MVPVRVITSPAPMALRTRTLPLVPSVSWKMVLWNQPEATGLQQTKPLVSEQFDLDAMNPSSPQRKEHPQWSRDCDLALRVLKEKLVSAPVLAFPCFVQNSKWIEMPVTVVWEHSYHSGKTERVIAYASCSRVLQDLGRRYSTIKQQMLAMVYAIKCFRHYLCGRPFTVRIDHNALKCLQSFKEPVGQMVRDVWAVRLQD